MATFVVVRLLKYPKKVFLDKQREKIVTRYVGIIVFFTIVPSLFLSYNLIRSSYFNDRVRNFVSEELTFPNTQILNKVVTDTSEKKEVKVVLIGQTVPDEMIANARAKLPKYGLKDVHLVVQQGFGQEATDINELKSLLMQDLYKNSVNTETAKPDTVMLVYLKSKTIIKDAERKKIREWLSARVEMKNIKLLIE